MFNYCLEFCVYAEVNNNILCVHCAAVWNTMRPLKRWSEVLIHERHDAHGMAHLENGSGRPICTAYPQPYVTKYGTQGQR